MEGIQMHMSTSAEVFSPGDSQVASSCDEDRDLEITSRAIRALSSPARLRILCLLFEGERSVVDLTRLIDGHTQSSVSQHLGFLLKSGIVVNRKYKTRMLYRISDDRTQLLMQMVVEIFCGQKLSSANDGAGGFYGSASASA